MRSPTRMSHGGWRKAIPTRWAGFAGTVHLITPLATLLGLADRPAEIPGLGPVDPALARDLARAAAQNPKTTWCVTVTDEQGHAIGHGCARPEPKSHRRRRERDGPGFAFTATGAHGPPGASASGYGTWRLHTGRTTGTCWSRSTRSPPIPATTGTRPRATIPGSSSGT